MSNYYDENELIRRIQKGDESALAIIISEYHAYVGKIVYSILGSYSHKIDLRVWLIRSFLPCGIKLIKLIHRKALQ